MGWDGSGSFTRNNGQHTGAALWAATKAGGRKIRTDDHDTHDEDLATGLENCLTRDGQNSPSANLPMNAKKHTGVAEATASDEYATKGQLDAATGVTLTAAQVGGTGNAITLTPATAITAYARGQFFRFVAENDNTDSVTIAVSSLTAKTLKLMDLTGAKVDLGPDLIQSGMLIEAWYDGTDFIWTSARPLAIWAGTEAEYTALSSKSDGAMYFTR